MAEPDEKLEQENAKLKQLNENLALKLRESMESREEVKGGGMTKGEREESSKKLLFLSEILGDKEQA